jgi:hypothetical protein
MLNTIRGIRFYIILLLVLLQYLKKGTVIKRGMNQEKEKMNELFP